MTGRELQGAARCTRVLAVVMLLASAGSGLGAQRSITQARARPESRSSWLLVTTADQGWDSNVRFLDSKDADEIRRMNSALTLVRIRPRSRIGVSASGSLLRYGRVDDFNTINYGGLIDASRRFTAFTSGWASAGFQKVLAATVAGTRLPLLAISNQTSTVATAGLEKRLTALTSLVIEGGYTDTRFDDVTLVPGHAYTASAELMHRYNSRERFGLEAQVQDGAAQAIPLRSQSLSAAWEPRVGSGTLRVAAGLSRTSTGFEPSYVPTGVLQYSDSLGPGVLLTGASRTVAQAFGIGLLLINDIASVSYEYRTRKGTFLSLGGNVAASVPSDGIGPTFTSQAVTADMRRVLASGVTFGLGASYRQRRDFVTASGYGGQVAVGYSLGSR